MNAFTLFCIYTFAPHLSFTLIAFGKRKMLQIPKMAGTAATEKMILNVRKMLLLAL